MTQRETERLTRVEENQEATNAKLDYLIERFDKYVEKSESDKESYTQKFITRAEGKAAMLLFSICVTLITVWLSLKDHIK